MVICTNLIHLNFLSKHSFLQYFQNLELGNPQNELLLEINSIFIYLFLFIFISKIYIFHLTEHKHYFLWSF